MEPRSLIHRRAPSSDVRSIILRESPTRQSRICTSRIKIQYGLQTCFIRTTICSIQATRRRRGIWLYQAGGEAYALYDEVRVATQARTAQASAEYAFAPQKAVALMHSYADLESETEYYPSEGGSWDLASEEAEPEANALAENALAEADKSKQDVKAEERLSPSQIRATFINSISKLNTAANQEAVEQYIWIFALKGPYEKVKYTWHEDNVPLLILYVLAVYAIAGFIIDVLAAGEDRWNLI